MTRSRRQGSSEGAELVEGYAASGLTQVALAAAEGVKMAIFQYWRRKARGSSSEETARCSVEGRIFEGKDGMSLAVPDQPKGFSPSVHRFMLSRAWLRMALAFFLGEVYTLQG